MAVNVSMVSEVLKVVDAVKVSKVVRVCVWVDVSNVSMAVNV